MIRESKVDKIITLADDGKYMVIEEKEYEGRLFLLLSKLDEKEELSNVIAIVEETEEDGKTYVNYIKNEDLLKRIAAEFQKKMQG